MTDKQVEEISPEAQKQIQALENRVVLLKQIVKGAKSQMQQSNDQLNKELHDCKDEAKKENEAMKKQFEVAQGIFEKQAVKISENEGIIEEMKIKVDLYEKQKLRMRSKDEQIENLENQLKSLSKDMKETDEKLDQEKKKHKKHHVKFQTSAQSFNTDTEESGSDGFETQTQETVKSDELVAMSQTGGNSSHSGFSKNQNSFKNHDMLRQSLTKLVKSEIIQFEIKALEKIMPKKTTVSIQTDKPKEDIKLPEIKKTVSPVTKSPLRSAPRKKQVAVVATQTAPLPKPIVPKKPTKFSKMIQTDVVEFEVKRDSNETIKQSIQDNSNVKMESVLNSKKPTELQNNITIQQFSNNGENQRKVSARTENKIKDLENFAAQQQQQIDFINTKLNHAHKANIDYLKQIKIQNQTMDVQKHDMQLLNFKKYQKWQLKKFKDKVNSQSPYKTAIIKQSIANLTGRAVESHDILPKVKHTPSYRSGSMKKRNLEGPTSFMHERVLNLKNSQKKMLSQNSDRKYASNINLGNRAIHIESNRSRNNQTYTSSKNISANTTHFNAFINESQQSRRAIPQVLVEEQYRTIY